MGFLGAVDIFVFHMYRHALRSRVESRAELVTHFLRGPTYAMLFVFVPNAKPAGAWLVALLGLLAVDLGISIADFWLEPASRAKAGGLPRGEYLLHVLLAMLFGALVASVCFQRGAALSEPSALGLGEASTPGWLRVVLAGMSPIALASGILDLRAAMRLGDRIPARAPDPEADLAGRLFRGEPE